MKNSLIQKPRSWAVIVFSTMVAYEASAAFTLLDNFDALTPGQIGGQNGWVANQGSAAILVGQDPGNAANQVLQIGDGSTTGNKTLWNLGIPAHNAADGATLFMRFRTAADVTAATADASFGLTIQNPPANNFNFQAQARVRGSATITTPELDARDGAAFLADAAVVFQLTAASWYNIWVVQDHPNDQYSVYLEGLGTTGQQLMFTEQNPLDYRVVGGGATLEAFFLRTGGTSGHLGPFYIDDIYVDTTGLNLANPVPEPSTWALLGIGMGGMLLAWRRQRRGAA